MKNFRSKGLLIQPDDLEVGQFYAVHGAKNESEEPVPIAGMAFRVKALNLPFVIGKLVCDASNPPVTFDVRYLNFMKVTDDFVHAQRPAEDAP